MVIVIGVKGEKMKTSRPFDTIKTNLETKKKMTMAKEGFEFLWELINYLMPDQFHGTRRDKEIILEKLKEAQMWASVALAEREEDEID